MKKSQFFALFNGLLKTLSATLVGLFLSVTGWAYNLNVTYQCPGGAVGSFTTASGATFPTVASKCAIGQELAYWTCIEQQISDMPIGSDTENSSFSGRVIKEGWTVNVNSNITLYCTPSLAVQGLDSNWYTDTFWLAPDLNYPNQNRVYMVCRVSALPTTTSSKSILVCRKRAGLIEAQKSAGSAYGNTFWVTKNGASLVDLLNSNDNKSIISTFPAGGVSSLIGTLTDNPGFQYFYNKTSTVDQRMWGYEVDFKCSENSTDPFARIVLAGCSNNLNIESLSSDLKTAISTKAQNACGSALLNNSNLWCTGFMNYPKNTNCSNNGTSGYTTITSSSSIYFPQGGTCYFRSPYQITLNKQNGSNGTNYVYEKYSDGYYTDANATSTNKMTATTNNITIPTRSGYVFGGYYTSTDGNGTQYINETGYITSNASNTYFTATGTLYAKWLVNCDAGTYLPANSETCAPCPASCPSGKYLPNNGTACIDCPAGGCPRTQDGTAEIVQGFYCPGGNYEIGSATNQGINRCVPGYPKNELGNSNIDSCYIEMSFYPGKGSSFFSNSYSSDTANKALWNRYKQTNDWFTYLTSTEATKNIKSSLLAGGSYAPTKAGHNFVGWKWQFQNVDPSTCTNNNPSMTPQCTNQDQSTCGNSVKRGCMLGSLTSCPSGWSYYGGLCIPDNQMQNNNNIITSSTNIYSGAQRNFYAVYNKINYNVTYDCGTGTGTPPPNTLQTFGTNFTVANTDGANCSKTGHHFTGWACKYLDGTDGAPNTGLTNNTTYNVAVDAQCTATWDVNTIYLDWNNDSGTTVTDGAPSCQYGGTINPVQTVSKNGYNFAGWDVVNEPGRGIIEDKQ